MKMQQCPDCKGLGLTLNELGKPLFKHGYGYTVCATCEGTGEIPAEPVSHCHACGEPIPVGELWCSFHQAAAELEQLGGASHAHG